MPSKKTTKKKNITKKNNVKVTGKKNTTNVQNVTVKIGSGKHGDGGGHRGGGGGGGGGGAGNKGTGRQQSSAPSTIVIQPPNPTSINPPIFYNPPAPQILGTAQSVATTLGSPAPTADYTMDDVQSEITTPAESYMTSTTYNSETPSMFNWGNYNKISPMNYMQSTDEATVASKNSFSPSLQEDIKHNLHSIPIDDYARAIKSEDADTIKSEDSSQSGNFNWGPYRTVPTTMNNMQSADEATVSTLSVASKPIKKEEPYWDDSEDEVVIPAPTATLPESEEETWFREEDIDEDTVASTGPATTGDRQMVETIWGDNPVPTDMKTWMDPRNRDNLAQSYEMLTRNKFVKGHPVHGVKNAALVVVNKLNP